MLDGVVLGGVHPTRPYYFEGYRSWLNPAAGYVVEVSPSWMPVDHGGRVGALVSLSRRTTENHPWVRCVASTDELAVSLASPRLAGRMAFGVDARTVLDTGSVREWVEPYTSAGEVAYTKAEYGDFSAWFMCSGVARSDAYVSVRGGGQKLDVDVPGDTGIYLTAGDMSYAAACTIHTTILPSLVNDLRLGVVHGGGATSLGCFYHADVSNTHLRISESLRWRTPHGLQPSLGLEATGSHGFGSLYMPGGGNSIGSDTLDNTSSMLSPFVRAEYTALNMLDIDLGFRLDYYRHLNARSGALLAIAPNYALKDATPVDLTYRCRLRYRPLDVLTMTLESGTYTQSPTALARDCSYGGDSLPSVKASKHAAGADLRTPIGLSVHCDGYYHLMWDIPDRTASDLWRLTSRGIEVVLRYRPPSLLDVSLAYALCEHTDHDVSISFDRRHKLSAHCGLNLPFGLCVAAGIVFTSGIPYTPISDITYNEHSGVYSPEYSEIDIATGASRTLVNARVTYSRCFGPLGASLFFEGGDLLSSGGQTQAIPVYTASGIPESDNIDTRRLAFGLELRLGPERALRSRLDIAESTAPPADRMSLR